MGREIANNVLFYLREMGIGKRSFLDKIDLGAWYFEILACSRPCLIPRHLSLDENLRAKEGGKEKTGYGPLRFVNSHSRVFRVSRSPVCEKRSV